MIIITAEAAAKIKAVLEEENDPNLLGLRIFIQGGGCGGFQYQFGLADTIDETDVVTEQNGIKVIIDAISFQYLTGSTIFYEKGIVGEQFVIKNPNVKNTCGCGSSFSV